MAAIEYLLNGLALDAGHGLCLGSLTYNSWAADVAELRAVNTHIGNNSLSDGATLADGSDAVLTADGVTLIAGKVHRLKRAGSGSSRSRDYGIFGPVHWLDTQTYQQNVKGATLEPAAPEEGEEPVAPELTVYWVSKCRLFINMAGEALSTSEQALEVLNFAAAQAGWFEVGGVDIPGSNRLPVEIQDQMVLSVLRQICRLHPEAELWTEYGGEKPLIYLGAPSSTTLVTFGGTAPGAVCAKSVDLERNPGLRPPCVVVKSQRVNDLFGFQRVQYFEQIAPEGMGFSSLTPGALVQTIDTRGFSSSYQLQTTEIVTAPVPPALSDDQAKLRKFYKRLHPFLSDPHFKPHVEHLRFYNHQVAVEESDDDEDLNDDVTPLKKLGGPLLGDGTTDDYTTDPEFYDHMVLEGEIPSTRKRLRSAPCVATCTVSVESGYTYTPPVLAEGEADRFKQLFGDNLFQGVTLTGSFTGTNAKTQRYVSSSTFRQEDPEPWPLGVAPALFAALNVDHYKGTIVVPTSPVNQLRPGRLIAIDGPAADPSWETMQAVIKSSRVQFNRDNAEVTATIGSLGALGIDDLVEVQRMNRRNPASVEASFSRDGTPSKTAPGGIRRGAKSNSVIHPAAHACNLAMYIKEAAVAVQDGTVNGFYPVIGETAINVDPKPTLALSANETYYLQIDYKEDATGSVIRKAQFKKGTKPDDVLPTYNPSTGYTIADGRVSIYAASTNATSKLTPVLCGNLAVSYCPDEEHFIVGRV